MLAFPEDPSGTRDSWQREGRKGPNKVQKLGNGGHRASGRLEKFSTRRQYSATGGRPLGGLDGLEGPAAALGQGLVVAGCGLTSGAGLR